MRKLATMAVAVLAAQLSVAEYNVAIGGYSMSNSVDCSWNICYGALSMADTVSCDQNVMLGIRAGQGMTDVRRSVGIGISSMRGANGLYHATDINGQFYADESNRVIRIGVDNRGDSNTPLSYSNGLWTVNGNLLVNGSISVGSSTVPSAQPSEEFDLYVDASRGDDGYDGTTPFTPKRTIDGAIAALTNAGERICLRSGHYAYPRLAHKRYLHVPDSMGWFSVVGIDGKENTYIDGMGLPPGTNNWICATTDSGGMCEFHGVTFKNWSSGTFVYWNNTVTPYRYAGPFVFLYFEDCDFADTQCHAAVNGYTGVNRDGGCVFFNCIFKSCSFRNIVVDGLGFGYYGLSPFLSACLAVDCDLSVTGRSDTRTYCQIAYDTHLFNSYMEFTGGSPIRWDSSIFGYDVGTFSCTYLNSDAPAGQPEIDVMDYAQFHNCLVGSSNVTATADNVVTNLSTVADGIDMFTHLPKYGKYQWIYYGIESNGRVMEKKAFAEQLISSVENVGTNDAPSVTTLRTALRAMSDGAQYEQPPDTRSVARSASISLREDARADEE